MSSVNQMTAEGNCDARGLLNACVGRAEKRSDRVILHSVTKNAQHSSADTDHFMSE